MASISQCASSFTLITQWTCDQNYKVQSKFGTDLINISSFFYRRYLEREGQQRSWNSLATHRQYRIKSRRWKPI